MRKYRKQNIYYTTPVKMYHRLKLINTPTPTEEKLWAKLKSRQLGVTFTRQKVILGYIVNFYCQKYKLAIEVDGMTVHDPKRDKVRDNHLNNVGVYVMRFTNDEVTQSLDSVLLKVRAKLLDSEKRSKRKSKAASTDFRGL